MSEIIPLEVTLELPASELIDHDNGLYVRCPINGQWIPLTDYYSEGQGSLLPLVGKVDYEEAPDHWDVIKDEKGETVLDNNNQPLMRKVTKENPIVWKEVVRILPATPQPQAEGGTLNLGVNDAVNTQDKF